MGFVEALFQNPTRKKGGKNPEKKRADLRAHGKSKEKPTEEDRVENWKLKGFIRRKGRNWEWGWEKRKVQTKKGRWLRDASKRGISVGEEGRNPRKSQHTKEDGKESRFKGREEVRHNELTS